ncbi:unnamed protein product, partial [Brassica oleracea]
GTRATNFNEAKKKKKKNSSHESNERNGNVGVTVPATVMNCRKRRLRLTESFFYRFSHGGDKNDCHLH